MMLNTFYLLVDVGLVVRLALAGKELERVNDTRAAQSTNSNPVQQLLRRMAHASRTRMGTLGSKLGSPTR